MSMKYREDLDEMVEKGCGNPDCDCKGAPLYLHPKCHPDAGCWPLYFEGELQCVCRECERAVLVVRVVHRSEYES